MGEDVTKLKKNIENLKKVMQGGWKDESKKEVSPADKQADKRDSSKG